MSAGPKSLIIKGLDPKIFHPNELRANLSQSFTPWLTFAGCRFRVGRVVVVRGSFTERLPGMIVRQKGELTGKFAEIFCGVFSMGYGEKGRGGLDERDFFRRGGRFGADRGRPARGKSAAMSALAAWRRREFRCSGPASTGRLARTYPLSVGALAILREARIPPGYIGVSHYDVIQELFRKTGVRTRSQLVRAALESNSLN